MTTTRGFDLVGEFRTTVPERMLQGFWRAGVLPNLISVGDVFLGDLRVFEQLQIYFDEPWITFEPTDRPNELTAIITQKTTFRAADRPGEALNTLIVKAPCILRDVVIREVPAQEIVLYFTNEETTQISWERSNLLYKQVEDNMVDQVGTLLAGLSRTIPISPIMIGAPLRFFIADGEGQLALKVFCNVDGRDGVIGDGKQDALVDPHPLKPWDPDDFAIAIDGGRLLQLANEAIVSKGLVAGATLLADAGKKLLDLEVSGDLSINTDTGISFLPEKITLPVAIDFSPTLQTIRLTSGIGLSLHNGYLRITGSIEAEIDNAFDADADFDLRIGFFLGSQKASATIIRADIDVDSTIYQALASLLFLPAAAIIASAVDEAIDTAASSAVKGMSFAADVPVETFVFGNIALTDDETQNALSILEASSDPPPERPIIVRAKPVQIMVRDDAVVVQGRLLVETPGAPPVVRPVYLIGHQKTMQFHQPTCKFARMIKSKDREHFVRPQDAVQAGFDGCRLCMLKFDGEGVGHLLLTYTRAVGLNRKRTTPIKVEGEFFSGTKQKKFQKPWTRTGTLVSSHMDGRWIDQLEIDQLAPGVWSITVTDGEWTATKTIGITSGGVASASITYGKDAPAIGDAVGSVMVVYRAPSAAALKKRLDPLIQGKWLGEPLPKSETSFWTQKAGVDFEFSPGVHAVRVRVFLRTGQWQVSALEWGKQVKTVVEVKAGEEIEVLFDRPAD